VQTQELDEKSIKTAVTLGKFLPEVWIACGSEQAKQAEALPEGLRLYVGEDSPLDRIISFNEKHKPQAILRIPAGCPEKLMRAEAIEEMASILKKEDADMCYSQESSDATFYEITAGRALSLLKEKHEHLLQSPRHYTLFFHNPTLFKVVSTLPDAFRKLQREVDGTVWFHTIEFGNGIRSHGLTQNTHMREYFKKLDCFQGKRVLDVGMADGLYSFLAEEKGAREVVGVDFDTYDSSDIGFGKSREIYEKNIARFFPNNKPQTNMHKNNFEQAKRILDSKVTRYGMTTYDIDPDKLGMFDTVLFLGVLYHLLDPMLGLAKARSICKGEMFLQTAMDTDTSDKPFMSFTEGGLSVKGMNFVDYSHWWTPNLTCLKAMIRTAGFSEIEELHVDQNNGYALLRCE
jgi:tRNA (mo5U34)-methyltransferase